MPIGFQKRSARQSGPHALVGRQSRRQRPRDALDKGAADAVLGKQNDDRYEPDDAVRTAQKQRGQRDGNQRDDEEGLAPADPVGPEPDRKLRQGREGRKRRDDPDDSVREPFLTQVKRQVGQREADRRHAQKIGSVESDSISHVHGGHLLQLADGA